MCENGTEKKTQHRQRKAYTARPDITRQRQDNTIQGKARISHNIRKDNNAKHDEDGTIEGTTCLAPKTREFFEVGPLVAERGTTNKLIRYYQDETRQGQDKTIECKAKQDKDKDKARQHLMTPS